MSIQDLAMAKVRDLPDPLAQEVSDFIDFLLIKRDGTRSQYLAYLIESASLAEAGIGEYAANLEDYEERLALGEVRFG